MGIVPGIIYNDGESTKITTLNGSFGFPLKDAKKKKSIMKRLSLNSFDITRSSRHEHHHAGESFEEFFEEEKEEMKEEEGEEDFSVPMTLDTPTATTLPTDTDHTTRTSGGSKSSKPSLSPKKQPRKTRTKDQQRKKLQKMPGKPVNKALKEASELLASGAWICGVCGTPFDTSHNAGVHEKACLVEWLKHDKLVQQAWSDEGRPRNTSGVPAMFLEPKRPLEYPEFLPPRTGGEIPISSPQVKKYLLITDEALVSVARRQRHVLHEVIDRDLCALSLKKQKAREDPSLADNYTDHDKAIHEDLFVWEREYDAMFEMEMSSRDRHYYAALERRAVERRCGPDPSRTHFDYYNHRLNRIRKNGTEEFKIDNAPEVKDENDGEEKEKFSLKKAIKGRLDHAYKLVKEGPASASHGADDRRRAGKDGGDDVGGVGDMRHDKDTLYINVVVKNSVQVVNNELQRIARGWWRTEQSKNGEDKSEKEVMDFQFEWIRAHTQKKVIQLAGIALASDFVSICCLRVCALRRSIDHSMLR